MSTIRITYVLHGRGDSNPFTSYVMTGRIEKGPVTLQGTILNISEKINVKRIKKKEGMRQFTCLSNIL